MTTSSPADGSTSAALAIDLALLWRRKWTLFCCLLVGSAAGVGYVLTTNPLYEAQARVLVEPRRTPQEVTVVTRVDPEFLPTQAETIRSPLTLERALQKVAVKPPASNLPWVKNVRAMFEEPSEFNAQRHVLRWLRVTPVLKANVLTVNYCSNDPQEAVELIQAVLESYEQHVADLDQGTNTRKGEVLASREREVRKDLKALQDEYGELRRKSPLFGQGREVITEAMTRLNGLAAQVSATRQKRLDMEVRLNTVSAAIASTGEKGKVADASSRADAVRVVAFKPLPQLLEDEVIGQLLRDSSQTNGTRSIAELEQELRNARVKCEQLDATLGAKHPDLITANAQAAELERMLQQRLQSVVGVLDRELQAMGAAEKRMEELYEAERQQTRAIDDYLLREETLRGNIQRLESLHAATMGRLIEFQGAEKAEAGGKSSIVVRVIDEPALLDEMAWPKPKLLVPAATCLGLMVGFCWVWLAEQRRTLVVPPPQPAMEPAAA